MPDRLHSQLQFLFEIDKIKNIARKTRNFSNDRFENDAEHSWHVAIMASILAEYANDTVDISRVVKMVLVHDVAEIDHGDVIVYRRTDEDSERERRAARRIFGMLPDDQRDEYFALWEEFEARETTDARFAAAIDRLEPVLQNILRNGESWNTHGIASERVFEINARIADGSAGLWSHVKNELQRLKDSGYLNR